MRHRTGKQLPELNVADTFNSPPIDLVEGRTEPPPLLTEADLIKQMDRVRDWDMNSRP